MSDEAENGWPKVYVNVTAVVAMVRTPPDSLELKAGTAIFRFMMASVEWSSKTPEYARQLMTTMWLTLS